jgi:hypothetical protein
MSVIPQNPRASRGLRPLGPLPGLCIGPAGDLKRSPDTSPNHTPPLTTNPGSAPDNQDNYPLFRDLISNTNWESIILEHPTVDSACELFTGKFMEIAHECIGTNTITIRPNDKISMTSEIRRELRVRDRLRKKFIQSKSILNERKYKDQCNKVNNLKKSAKIEFYVSINETLSDLNNVNSKQYWKTIKMLIKGECNCSDLPPLRQPHEISPSTFDNIDKCNTLNNYFCSISDLQDEHTELPDFDNRGRNTLTDINI